MNATLSVIVPVFNEEGTIREILEKVTSVELLNGMKMEVLVVDDGSEDLTGKNVEEFSNAYPEVNLIHHRFRENRGKGAAIRKGVELAGGDYIIIQDADLEYDPREYNDLLKPMVEEVADVVYSSRFVGNHPHRILFFWHSIGNKVLTFLSNALTNLNLTDMESCYKLFRREILRSITLKENRFGFEPEVTAKIARIPGIRIYEVGISYYGRTYGEGKKINWKDGMRAVYCILKYNLPLIFSMKGKSGGKD
ncbi:MAG: glycosyltransferase family 2 protein [Marinilabiliaceae bacterium]